MAPPSASRRSAGHPAVLRGPARSPSAQWLPGALAGTTVLVQVLYPLVSGTPRNALTVATVLLFAAASTSAAAMSRGARFAAVLVVTTVVIGFGAEALGVATGVPFGSYSYAGTLGPRLLGVPVIIPLAWTMMAYPALLVGWRVARRPAARIAVGAIALASWDVFLDPQMVDAGHWRFAAGDGPRLTGIPLVNFAGWLLVAALLLAVLTGLLAALPRPTGAGTAERAEATETAAQGDAVPLGLYLWTYGSSLLANLAFFGRPAVALAGGLAMGVPVLLLARALRRRTAPQRR